MFRIVPGRLSSLVRSCIALPITASLAAASCGTSPPQPADRPVASPPVATYAVGTPQPTREAHREAARYLRAGEARAACAELEAVIERRAITDYLAVLCMTRIPELALHADDVAEQAAYPDQAPVLRDEHRLALDRHRAWIAGVQDALADAAMSTLQIERPRPGHLQGSRDLMGLAAWWDRGAIYHRSTYEAAREAGVGHSLEGRLALSAALAELDPANPGDIYFIDLSGLDAAPPPAMVLPADDEL